MSSINKLSFEPKSVCYEFKINLNIYPNPQLEQTKLLCESLPESFIIKQKYFLSCKLYIKYTDKNIYKIIDIVKETKEYISDLVLEINTSAQSAVLMLIKILVLDCFNKLVLKKRYHSMELIKNMKNVKNVSYLNHFYSNIKLLPAKIKVLKIDIKSYSNVFFELPEEPECILFVNPYSNKYQNIELKNYNISSILFVNSNKQISNTELFETELLILNTNNDKIDFKNLTSKIKIIYFNEGYKINGYELDYLPNSIEELNFNICENFNYQINTFMNLPSSVKKIKFNYLDESNYDYDYDYFPFLPDSIEYIDIDMNFRSTQVQILNEKTNFNLKKIPNKLKQLHITIRYGCYGRHDIGDDFEKKLLNEFNKYKTKTNNKFDLIIESLH